MAMRKTWFALAALACLGGVGRTQTTPEFDPAKNPLDGYLQRWEEAMKKVESLALRCSRTELDKIYKTKKTFTGTIHFLKPTYFFWNMTVDGKPHDFERFVCTGNYIYQYVPAQKEIRVYPAPKQANDGRVADDTSVAFLFGMKAVEARKRYDLKLFKVDAHYIYVDVEPRMPVDRADFQKARIILDKGTYLPRQIWFEHPNSGEVTWDIPAIQSGAKLDKAIFATPSLPAKDWKMVQGQAPSQPGAEPKPRLVRPTKP
jgi:TIGR03009 family protein